MGKRTERGAPFTVFRSRPRAQLGIGPVRLNFSR
jgi:hypothetical protein